MDDESVEPTDDVAHGVDVDAALAPVSNLASLNAQCISDWDCEKIPVDEMVFHGTSHSMDSIQAAAENEQRTCQYHAQTWDIGDHSIDVQSTRIQAADIAMRSVECDAKSEP